MDWKVLSEDKTLNELIRNSETRAQVIFKHSIRCSISSMIKGRLERSASPENADFYFLDLIRYRDLSNKIAETFFVEHESPQILVIRNGNCVYHESHMSITMNDIAVNTG